MEISATQWASRLGKDFTFMLRTEVAICSIIMLCDACCVQKFRQLYDKEKEGQGEPSAEIQFAYAWCLVRSKQTADLRLGTQLLEGTAFIAFFLTYHNIKLLYT